MGVFCRVNNQRGRSPSFVRNFMMEVRLMDADVWEDDTDDRRDAPGNSSDLKKLQQTHMNVHWIPESHH